MAAKLSREEMIKKSEVCRDEVVAVLKKYDARLVYHHSNAYSEDRGGIDLAESKNKDGYPTIPVAELEIVVYDFSM